VAGGLFACRERLSFPSLSFAEVVVRGCSRVHPTEVIKWATLQSRANALWVNLTELQKKIETHPWVKQATLRRQWRGRLEVSVQEHEPAALLLLDTFYLVDRKGNVFAKPQADYKDLPVITGLGRMPPVSQSAPSGRLIRQALLLLKTIQEEGVPAISRVSEVHVNENFGLTVIPAEEPVEIKFGFAPFRKKLSLLNRVERDLIDQRVDATWIDLRFDDRVYVLPRARGKPTQIGKEVMHYG
jgi:cell division protein FtsQ